MRFTDQFRFVRQNMKKNKTRLFMTVLATAMGCTFLIVLASVGFGLQKSIVEDMVGDRMVTAIDIYGVESNNEVDRVIDADNIEYLRTVDHVKAVTYRNYVQQALNPMIDGQAVGSNATVNVDFAAESKAGFGLSAGRLPQEPREVIVGFNIRQTPQQSGAAGGDTPPADAPPAKEWLGKIMELKVKQLGEDGKERTMKLPVTIVGISEQPSREWQTDSNVYIGNEILTELEAFTGTQWGAMLLPEDSGNQNAEQPPGLQDPRQFNQVQVIADGANRVKGISEEIREKGYMSHSIASELKQINLVFTIMKIGLGFVGTIAVLIASIGIFNTMTMAVTERSQDIGIMKAIGAHPSAIRRIFLLESSLIGLLGAVIGTVVAYVISIVVNIGLPIAIEAFMEEQVPDDFVFSFIPPYLAVIACLISLGVALLSGSRPAKRATRIDVLSALRRDI
ncbi:ABC transporter permease [Cohnella lupini]|uniref:Acetoin utilization transport system permease protein n=1 Tax=Cohnella lupini TaxID=1294267 RepID=A0A3D9IT36_9BACL|nr:FtsX-like permease family protein [Cohnella lupini]RED64930.1 acetoin utilization transport system permease protein [Cohnella lupini]